MYRVLEILTPPRSSSAARSRPPRRSSTAASPTRQYCEEERAATRQAAYEPAPRCFRPRWRGMRAAQFRLSGGDRAAVMTRYQPGLAYGAHTDAAYLQLPGMMIRSDISCTIFLNPPESYEGGASAVDLGRCQHPLQAAARLRDPLSIGHAARGRAGHQGRAAGRDHVHPERIQDPFRRTLSLTSTRLRRSRD